MKHQKIYISTLIPQQSHSSNMSRKKLNIKVKQTRLAIAFTVGK